MTFQESGAFRRDVSRSCDAVYSEVPAPFTAHSRGTWTTARPLCWHTGREGAFLIFSYSIAFEAPGIKERGVYHSAEPVS